MKRQLPKVTLLGIDCSNIERLQLAADICMKDFEFGSVKLLSSIPSNDPRVVKIPPIKNIKKYSEFVVKELYKYVDTDFVLVIQFDGFILNPFAWSDEFLKYDYIGAPWHQSGLTAVGNGGFSLRSRRLLNWLGEHWPEIRGRLHPEDVFICKNAHMEIEKAGMIYAPISVASKFSKEGDKYSVMWDGEFGFHGDTYTDISRWLDNNPEYKEKLNFKLNDYVTLMRKYPTNDGTVHTFYCRRQDMGTYRKLSRGEINYSARVTYDRDDDYSTIKVGHMIVFKRHGVSFKELPIPIFEKRVVKIETFNSFYELRKKYPKLKVTYPLQNLKRWQRKFIPFFGDWAYPKNRSYSVFWF